MKTLKAKHRSEDIFIHYVSKLLEYVLVSRNENGTGMFKLGINEISGVKEEELYSLLRQQEFIEQEKRKGA